MQGGAANFCETPVLFEFSRKWEKEGRSLPDAKSRDDLSTSWELPLDPSQWSFLNFGRNPTADPFRFQTWYSPTKVANEGLCTPFPHDQRSAL